MIKILALYIGLGFSLTAFIQATNFSKFSFSEKLESGAILFVADSTDYSSEFIYELKSYYALFGKVSSVQLIHDTLYVGKSEKHQFPLLISKSEKTTYQSFDGKNRYVLELTQFNYTSIKYKLSINNVEYQSGKVTLSADFFLEEETENDENNETFAIYRVFDKTKNYLYMAIESKSATRIIVRTQLLNSSTKLIKPISIIMTKHNS